MPLPDNRKSKEQLDAELAALDKLEEEDVEEEEENESDNDTSDKNTPDDSDNNGDEDEDNEDDEEAENSQDRDKDQPDRKDDTSKQRLDESIKGANLEHEKNKHFKDALAKATEIKDVEESEVIEFAKGQGLEWDDMTNAERLLAKQTLINEKRFNTINESVKESDQVDEWRTNVDEWVDNDESIKQFPRLEGKEVDFKKFAMKPSRRNMDLEDVAILFLAANPEVKKKKGSLLLNGSGGEKVKKPEMTADDISKLRSKDQKTYLRMVKEGKIDPTKDL